MEMENFEILLEQIAQMVKNGEISALRELLTELNVVDIAQLIEELETGEKLPVYRVLPKDISAEVFAYLEPETQSELIRRINDTELECDVYEGSNTVAVGIAAVESAAQGGLPVAPRYAKR